MAEKDERLVVAKEQEKVLKWDLRLVCARYIGGKGKVNSVSDVCDCK